MFSAVLFSFGIPFGPILREYGFEIILFSHCCFWFWASTIFAYGLLPSVRGGPFCSHFKADRAWGRPGMPLASVGGKIGWEIPLKSDSTDWWLWVVPLSLFGYRAFIFIKGLLGFSTGFNILSLMAFFRNSCWRRADSAAGYGSKYTTGDSSVPPGPSLPYLRVLALLRAEDYNGGSPLP